MSLTASLILPWPATDSALNALVSEEGKQNDTPIGSGGWLTCVVWIVLQQSVCDLDALREDFFVVKTLKQKDRFANGATAYLRASPRTSASRVL